MYAHDKLQHVAPWRSTVLGKPCYPVLVIDASPEGLAELKQRAWAKFKSAYKRGAGDQMALYAALSVLAPKQPRAAGKRRQ